MTRVSHQIVYPEGESQEIGHSLRAGQIVDLNGVPLGLPLPTTRMIAYRVYRKSTRTTRGEEIVSYHLELLTRDDLEDLV